MASSSTNPVEENSQGTPPGVPENPPKQTTKDVLLERFKRAGFQKKQSPNGGGCVITGFRPPEKASPEPPPKPQTPDEEILSRLD